MLAKVIRPIFELSATMMVCRANFDEGRIRPCLGIVMRRAARVDVDSVDTDEGYVEVVTEEGALCDRPRQLERRRAADAAGEDETDVPVARELHAYVERVGDDCELAHRRQRTRNLHRRRTAGDAYDGAFADQRRGSGGDATLLGNSCSAAIADRHLEPNIGPHGAAM